MAKNNKVIITCAVTGAIHTPSMSPHLPVTPQEIADAAIGAGPYAAVLMTSGNAARAIAVHPRRASLLALDCFAVGAQTAAAAAQASTHLPCAQP